MLRELYLRNIGVIAAANIAFGPGLNVITGETGVGKTLLVTSLGLITGARAPARLVAPGAEEASVEAVVELAPPTAERLRTIDVDAGEELILARRVSADGRTKAWADGRLVPVSVLAEIGEVLIEVHGQGAGFALGHPSTQLRALDALAGTKDMLAAYSELLQSLRALQAERSTVALDASAREREAELLAFQADEIERAALQPGEDDAVAGELSRLEHAERLAAVADRVLDLAGTDGASGRLAEAHHALEPVVALDAGVGPLVERLGEIATLASDVMWDIRAWAEAIDGDPDRVEALRQRKASVAALRRKYGATVEEVIDAGAAARARLDELSTAGDRLEEMDAELARLRTDAEALAAELSSRRAGAARVLTDMVGGELPALALPGAVFEVECTATEEWTATGRDRVAFRFSESNDRPADLIGKIASGGELSRAMIAVTLCLAQAHDVPVLVFDEADQGIGGEAALEVARRLGRLARTHQVLVVSHLPQIAAFADRHLAVRRGPDGVAVDLVRHDDRITEISRMLAGLESSKRARAHARELIELADAERTTDQTATPAPRRSAVGR